MLKMYCIMLIAHLAIRCTSLTFHIEIFSSETTVQNKTKLHCDGPWLVPMQNCV
jgi:hypothetical protein